MDVTTLRIGNLIYGVSDRIETVVGITEKTISAYAGKLETTVATFEAEDFSPIEITEEWLVKFGFKRNDNLSAADESWEFPIRMGLFFLAKHTTAVDKTTYYGLVFPGEHKSVYTPVFNQCQYVHQLQNLFYALTNQELKYDL